VKIFLSWSGISGKRLAILLKKNIEGMLSPVNVFVSESDIESGEKWGVKLQKELETSGYGIICITKESLDSPWLLFEAGALSKYSESRVCCLLTDKISKNDLPSPLQQFQNKHLTKKDFSSLIFDINRQLDSKLSIDEHRLTTSFNNFWPTIDKEYKAILGEFHSEQSELNDSIENVIYTLKKVSKRKSNLTNTYLARVIKDSIDDFDSCFSTLSLGKETFKQPYILYPHRLLSLLVTLSPTVKALALVDVEEKFWRDKLGMEIWRNTNENSSRVFVFHNSKQMTETMPTLLSHSKKYNVYALSYDNLLLENSDYNYDFSIIGDPSMRVLARYQYMSHMKSTKEIIFETQGAIVSAHEDVINTIINSSILITDEANEDALLDQVFTPLTKKLESYEHKKVEMSAYIPVIDYDQYEEQHAYYIEMIEIILKKISKLARRRKIRVLELGAGTGIFTKRLALINNIEIVAIEIDWACFVQLDHNIHNLKKNNKNIDVECLNEDSRVCDPEGDFQVIVSVFADHHIKPYDKYVYFNNVRLNLCQGGTFIVGDEFLPDYSDVRERREALEKYHGHIIEIANQKEQYELAKLEGAALKSGLDEVGDFKLTNGEYEKLLSNEGFKFNVTKVGPLDIDNVGGVFIYDISKNL